MPSFSLAYLTAMSLAPPDAVQLAADLGYQTVGLRLCPAAPGADAYPLHDDRAMLAATVERIKATGVDVLDIEIIRIGEHFDLLQYVPFLEAGAALGAKAVLVAGDDPNAVRLAENFAQLCQAVRPYGLTADLEFMPWTAVRNVSDAVRVIHAAGDPVNAGLLVDALHYGRSASTAAEIAALPGHWLHYAQICDAPAIKHPTDAELIHAARRERLLPGEGVIDLHGLFAALPRTLPISVEIPSESRTPLLGVREWARRALATSQATVRALPAQRTAQHS